MIPFSFPHVRSPLSIFFPPSFRHSYFLARSILGSSSVGHPKTNGERDADGSVETRELGHVGTGDKVSPPLHIQGLPGPSSRGSRAGGLPSGLFEPRDFPLCRARRDRGGLGSSLP